MSPRFEWSCRTVELGSRSFWELAGVEGWVFSAYMEPVHPSIRLGSILLRAANSGELPWCSFVMKMASAVVFGFMLNVLHPVCLRFVHLILPKAVLRISTVSVLHLFMAYLLQRRIFQPRQAFADQPLRFYLAYMKLSFFCRTRWLGPESEIPNHQTSKREFHLCASMYSQILRASE